MGAHRVTEADLFKLLRSRESKDGFDAAQISSRVAFVIDEAWPLLQQVSRSFPLYTLHDPEHSYRVVQSMYNLMPKATLQSLNSIELSVLIYAAYLHDIGMASSQDEFYNWLRSPAYMEYASSRERWVAALQSLDLDRSRHWSGSRSQDQVRPTHDSDEVEENSDGFESVDLRCLQDVIYTDFLRATHAARSADYILRRHGPEGESSHRIQVGEVNYASEVAAVCQSHWEDTTALKLPRYRRDLYVGRFPVNLQYCAIILRLADVLDLDPERTPAVLLDFILLDLKRRNQPFAAYEEASSKSAEEWAKHRAILGLKISPEEVRLEARCSHPAIQKGLREWCDYIDAERRGCRVIVRDNVEEIARKYQLDLSLEVRKDYIQSDGTYIYTDFQLQLDYDRVVSLLMGTQLWGDPIVVVRELLQNALDACSHRAALSRALGFVYTPRITFSVDFKEELPAFVLRCEDNGVGMSQEIIERYLIRIGSSYYESSEFRHQNLDFRPISHFGLGLMSCFMLSSRIVVETQHVTDLLEKGSHLRVEIDSAGRYVVLRPMSGRREGTSVSVPIAMGSRGMMAHESARHEVQPFDLIAHDLGGVLRELAVHLAVPVEVLYGGRDVHVIQPAPFQLPVIEESSLPGMRGRFREFTFEFTHEKGRGIAGNFRFLLPVSERGEVCLGCAVESSFKLFIDGDGDLCLTTPNYKDDKIHIYFPVNHEDWDTEEWRGVYRYKYGRKPATERYGGDGLSADILEMVRRSFRWSQDGLLVGWLSRYLGGSDVRDRSKVDNRELEKEVERQRLRLFKLVPVPGLNAADIDLRDHARVTLNVQRSDFQRDSSLDSFRQKYYGIAAEMWLQILAESDALPPSGSNLDLLYSLLEHASRPLLMQLQAVIPQMSDQRFRRRMHRHRLRGDIEDMGDVVDMDDLG